MTGVGLDFALFGRTDLHSLEVVAQRVTDERGAVLLISFGRLIRFQQKLLFEHNLNGLHDCVSDSTVYYTSWNSATKLCRAGFAVGGFAEDIQLKELRLQFETNFFGAVAMTKAVLPIMRQQRSGHMIQISSIGGLQGAVSVSSYSASKHALEGWSESLRLEVNSLGIKVVLVEPGAFDTGVWTSGAVM